MSFGTATILSSGDFRRVVRGEVFMPGAWVFHFLNASWCLVWFACFPFIFFALLYCHVLCSVVSLCENWLSHLHSDYID